MYAIRSYYVIEKQNSKVNTIKSKKRNTSKIDTQKEVLRALDMYVNFAKEYLALDVYSGRKSESEKFAGAVNTYGVEALMQDGKALQFGTSHDLGQNFA